jgi:hypothetical protein
MEEVQGKKDIAAVELAKEMVIHGDDREAGIRASQLSAQDSVLNHAREVASQAQEGIEAHAAHGLAVKEAHAAHGLAVSEHHLDRSRHELERQQHDLEERRFMHEQLNPPPEPSGDSE